MTHFPALLLKIWISKLHFWNQRKILMNLHDFDLQNIRFVWYWKIAQNLDFWILQSLNITMMLIHTLMSITIITVCLGCIFDFAIHDANHKVQIFSKHNWINTNVFHILCLVTCGFDWLCDDLHSPYVFRWMWISILPLKQCFIRSLQHWHTCIYTIK